MNLISVVSFKEFKKKQFADFVFHVALTQYTGAVLWHSYNIITAEARKICIKARGDRPNIF